jgi:hypothetical protein
MYQRELNVATCIARTPWERSVVIRLGVQMRRKGRTFLVGLSGGKVAVEGVMGVCCNSTSTDSSIGIRV